MAIASALSSAPAAAAEGPSIPVPSGERVYWLDVVRDAPGVAGLTYRYRFVMPDLAGIVPSTSGPAEGMLTEEDAAELDALSGDGPVLGPDGSMIEPDGDAVWSAEAEAELVDIEDLDLPDFVPGGNEAAADSFMVPAEPDILLQDPMHADIVWLCENWVLPRLVEPSPLPGQIVISLADRPTEFGAFDPEAVQLFEAFTPSADRKTCVWSPW